MSFLPGCVGWMDGWGWAKCRSLVQGHGGTGKARVQSREAEAGLTAGTWQEGFQGYVEIHCALASVHACCQHAPSSLAIC